MSRGFLAIVVALLTASFTWSAEDDTSTTENNQDLARQISRLVRQLDDNQAAQRDAAEKELLDLAGSTAAETDRFLELLPEENDQMPLAVRDRLTNIRQQVEDRTAKSVVVGTRLTLSAKEMPLGEVFAAIEKQTGNRLIDNRQENAAEPAELSGKITIELKDEPFWPAVDRILDEADLDIYSYGGEPALSIVSRGMDYGNRHGRASYAGPFRLEVLQIQGQRNLRQQQRATLQLQLEVAWEPRLRRSRSRSQSTNCKPPPTPALSCPSASRMPSWMSKCRMAHKRLKSSCLSIYPRDRPPKSPPCAAS